MVPPYLTSLEAEHGGDPTRGGSGPLRELAVASPGPITPHRPTCTVGHGKSRRGFKPARELQNSPPLMQCLDAVRSGSQHLNWWVRSHKKLANLSKRKHCRPTPAQVAPGQGKRPRFKRAKKLLQCSLLLHLKSPHWSQVWLGGWGGGTIQPSLGSW